MAIRTISNFFNRVEEKALSFKYKVQMKALDVGSVLCSCMPEPHKTLALRNIQRLQTDLFTRRILTPALQNTLNQIQQWLMHIQMPQMNDAANTDHANDVYENGNSLRQD